MFVCRSDQRDTALKLCGWAFEQDLDRFINNLCENKVKPITKCIMPKSKLLLNLFTCLGI